MASKQRRKTRRLTSISGVRRRKTANIVFPNKPNNQQLATLYKYLDRIYYDPASGGAFSSPSKLLHEVKRRGYYRRVGLRRIQKYLNNQTTYTLYKPAKSKFPTPAVRVNKINEQFDIDLMDVSKDSSHNDGTRFLLSMIDVLSKYGYVLPLKSKQATEVARAAETVFDAVSPERICSDRGREFLGQPFQQMIERKGIRHFYAGGSGMCSVVERFNRTIKSRIAKFQFKKNTMRYVDALPSLVKGYNKSYHRSIKMKPEDVNEENEHIAYENLYSKRTTSSVIPYQFNIGDAVRISGKKHPFRREFFQRWSEEIFTITKRWRQQNINMYKIKDCSDEEIVGTFYAAELAKVTTSPDDMYRVESFLDEKVENGMRYVKVKWQGYPKHCATWILKSAIRNV